MVRTARKRAIVEEDISRLDVVKEFGDRAGRQIHRHNVDRQGIFDRYQTMIVSQDSAGKIARVLDNSRPARAHDDKRHLAHHCLETAFENGHKKRIYTTGRTRIRYFCAHIHH